MAKNDVSISIVRSFNNAEFRKGVRWWALTEAWLVSARWVDKLTWRYWALFVQERRTFGLWRGASPRQRLVRVAAYLALLRASGTSATEVSHEVTEEAALGMDVDLLFSLAGSTRQFKPALLEDVFRAYNAILNQAASLILWLTFSSASLKAAQRNENKVIFFDLDPLLPGSTIDQTDRLRMVVALAGLLSLPTEQIKKNVLLISSRRLGQDSVRSADILVGMLGKDYPSFAGVLNRIRKVKVVSRGSFTGAIFQNGSIVLDPLLSDKKIFPAGPPTAVDFWTMDNNKKVTSSLVKIVLIPILPLSDRISRYLKRRFVAIRFA